MLRQYYEEIINYLIKGTFWKGATSAERNVISKRASKYKVINGVLYHKGKGRGIEDLRLVATSAPDQQNAVRLCHVSEADNQHYGINKTAALLAGRFYWRMMYTDVIKYVQNCSTCQEQKKENEVPVQSIATDDRIGVWRMLEVEVLDHFLVNGKKMYHLLRLVDVHSNWATFSFLEDVTERTTVRALFRECSILGFPLAFRFVLMSKDQDQSWTNRFVSALHQELDGFSGICGQPVDTSVHVVVEDTSDDWQAETCVQNCQDMILDNPAALYVFFGTQSVVEQGIHDWYLDEIRQLIKKEPFWWPQRLSTLMFHLRNTVPPGMTCSPASLLSLGVRSESSLFLPLESKLESSDETEKGMGKEEEAKEVEPIVALPAPKELMAQSLFRVGQEGIGKDLEEATPEPINQSAEPKTSTQNDKNVSESPAVKKSTGKRKPEGAKAGTSAGSVKVGRKKRLHLSSKSASIAAHGRTEDEQRKIDADINDSLDMAISKGLKDLEEQKKKGKKHRRKKGEKDMFAMPDSLILPPSGPQTVNDSSGMSSLEALKAVTGAGVPQRVPASPLLPSTLPSSLSGTLEDSRCAGPVEEGTSGRYSFGQNLKPTGSSNFIRQLIAKSSSKRYTTGTEDSNHQLPVPKRRRRHHRNKRQPIQQTTPDGRSTYPPSTSLSNQDGLILNSLLPSSHMLDQNITPVEMSASPSLRRHDSLTAFDEDVEPNCSLGLTRAEEELINQSIKGVVEDGLMDTDKMVVDEVLSEDVTKDDLNNMEVLETDDLHISSCANSSPSNVEIGITNGDLSELSLLKTDVFVEKNLLINQRDETICHDDQNVMLTSKILQTGSSQNAKGGIFNDLQHVSLQNQNVSVSEDIQDVVSNNLQHMGLESFNNIISEQQVPDKFELSSQFPFVNESEVVKSVECDMDNNAGSVQTHADDSVVCENVETAMDMNMEVVNSEVIYDVLDTCATYEVADREIQSQEVSENIEDKELELIHAKISEDLASGLTVDKTKSVVQNNVETDNADTDEFNIMASVCDALLHMSNATNFATEAKDKSVIQIEVKPVELQTSVPVPQVTAMEVNQVEKTEKLVEEKLESVQPVLDSSKSNEAAESELCLPSEFIIDEELLSESSVKPSATDDATDKPPTQPKLAADQDIVTILNSIMNNRAFLDDPVVRAQRDKEDNYFKKLHGLKRDIRIRIKAIADLVVQRAVLGPVPVRTIRNIYRRAYYVGNVKIDEFKTAELLPPSASGPGRPPGSGPKKARVLLPKVWPSQVIRDVQMVKPSSPTLVNRPGNGDGGKTNTISLNSVIKKGKKGLGCPICPRTYLISQKMLDLHLQFHIDNARNLHCPVCGKAGTIWTNILKHYLGHPEIKNNASLYEMILATCDKDRTQCGQCNTLFAMRNALIHHLASSHIGEKVNGSSHIHLVEEVPIKQPTSDTIPLTKSESEPKDVNYLCPNCPYSTKTHYNLVLHNHECQGNVQKFGDSFSKVLDELTPQFKCSLCGYCGVSSKQLEQHVHLHHGNSNATNNRSVGAKSQEVKYSCELCPMKFRTKEQYKCHLHQHKEDQMFQCKACAYKCRYKKNMHKHARSKHPDMSLKGLIQAPKKGKMLLVKQQKTLKSGGVGGEVDTKDAELEEEDNEDEGIPTATVVVHTDENGELTVCDENDVPSMPLQPEQTTFLLDSSVLGGSAVTLDGGALTLDGNVLQILQGDGTSSGGQPKVLFLSVGPSDLGQFTIAEQNNIS